MKKFVIAVVLCVAAIVLAMPGAQDARACPQCPVVGTCPDPCTSSCCDAQLQADIERALEENQRLAVYYLPEANGGHQALVRQIVVDTIANVAASGENTNLANSKLAGADLEISAGRHKRAWAFLAQAYFEAIKLVGEAQ